MRVDLKFYVASVAALPDFTSPVSGHYRELTATPKLFMIRLVHIAYLVNMILSCASERRPTQLMSLQNLLRTLVLLLVFVPLKTKTAPQSDQTKATNESAANLPVTLPRKAPLPPIEAMHFFGAGSAHWNGPLFVGALWPMAPWCSNRADQELSCQTAH
jgi:hypothetical protein